MAVILNIQEGHVVPIELLLCDGAIDQYPQAKVYNQASSLLITINLTHDHQGNYSGTPYNMPNTDYLKIIFTVFKNVGHTIENEVYERAIDIFYKILPDEFKATGFAVPNEYDTVLTNIKDKTDTLDWTDIDFINDIEGGKWNITEKGGGTMIFYKADNITEVARFALYDINGQRTSKQEDAVRRDRI